MDWYLVKKIAIYRNDRSGDKYSYTINGKSSAIYAPYSRLITNKKPSYKCGTNAYGTSLYLDANIADKFTKSTSTGNGK